ncbi:MAG: histidine kinase [Methylomonas sp.]|uniref:histidine kinase n=1 Tax=Methylomonas sp. TaxID=418 RepID=UPI0025E6A242|nr:histidine kinase [Methylomonas sp.]MCK9607210.1 histidine kinase [Methylomonas sp.]
MTLTPHIRIERLIILSRAGLASFSWLAGWLDPIGPEETAKLTQWILVFYLSYSWSLLIILKLFPLQTKYIGLATHFFDVLIFTALIAITYGGSSPFFTYFIFALFAAALRWQKSGILWSALAFLCLYSGTGIFLDLNLQLDSSELELNRFIIRNVHLIVVSLLLIYLTTYEKNIRTELGKLSEWPTFDSKDNDLESFIFDTLSYATETLQTPRLLMLWEETEQPGRHAALLTQDHFDMQPIGPNVYPTAVPEILKGCNFLCNDLAGQPAKTLCVTAKSLKYRAVVPLQPDLISQYHIKSVIGLVLDGQAFVGHLLLLDKPEQSLDDLNLGILAAQQVALRMDQFLLYLQQKKTAAIDERIKMARDLHDGVLQTLTGIALQVKTITRTLESNSDSARQGLENLQSIIRSEQSNLRQFIQQLKPAAAEHRFQISLNDRLRELAETVSRQWGLEVRLSEQSNLCPLSRVDDVYPIVREAIINCARHADAGYVELSTHIGAECLHIHVFDDGHGFPFTGDYDLAQLTKTKQGPKTIMERILSLQGNLTIHSHPNGTELDISLPLNASKQRHDERPLETNLPRERNR